MCHSIIALSLLLLSQVIVAYPSRAANIQSLVARERNSAWKNSGKIALGVGIQWAKSGTQNSYLPQIELQYALMRNLSVGVLGQFENSSLFKNSLATSKFALGGGVHYYSISPFHGFWWQAGLKENFSYTEMAVYSTAGWRWRNNEHPLSMGAAIGIERVFSSAARFVPIMRVDAAVDFNPEHIFN